ncbi:MAG: cytochrome c oxidase subunit 3 [Vicinamibacterales bacterium]
MQIPYTVEARPDTGLYNGKLGIWLFLASEVMLFAGLFSSYILLRTGSPEWPHHVLPVAMATVNTGILITSSMTMVMAWASLKMNDWSRHRTFLALTVLLGVVFLGIKLLEYPCAYRRRRAAIARHVLRDLLHADRGACAAYRGRSGGDALFPGAGRSNVGGRSGALHQSHRIDRSLLALRRLHLDLPVSAAVPAVRMHG